jgi:elongation factor 1-gamma
MADAYEFYLNGIEQALSATPYIAGEELTIADIGFACDLAQFLRERMMTERLQGQGFAPVSSGLERDYPRCHTHLTQLVARPAFSQWLDGYFSL